MRPLATRVWGGAGELVYVTDIIEPRANSQIVIYFKNPFCNTFFLFFGLPFSQYVTASRGVGKKKTCVFEKAYSNHLNLSGEGSALPEFATVRAPCVRREECCNTLREAVSRDDEHRAEALRVHRTVQCSQRERQLPCTSRQYNLFGVPLQEQACHFSCHFLPRKEK
jgi:hypothetical protein